MRPRVVGLGLCVVDHLYLVDDLAASSERVRYRERVASPGGMVATALVQAARLGCDAHLLSALGADPEGRALARTLRERGVVTRRVVRPPGHPTTVAVVLVTRRSGERRFVVPDRRALERDVPDFDLAPITQDAVLLVDGHFPAQALRAVRRARERGVRVVGDFNRPGPGVRRLLPYVTHPVVPSEFVRAYTGGDARATLRRLRRDHDAQPVVTEGARGGLYLDGGRVRRYASPRVRVVDTTGAGDAFHGAFAAALARGRPHAEAIAIAARAGALACTALGMGRLAGWREVSRR
jgi:sulfofructose kinase